MLAIADKYKATESDSMDLIESADKAFEEYKKKYEESCDLVNPGIIPIGANVLLSAKLHSIEESGKFLVSMNFNVDAINSLQTSISDIQEVIAIGPDVKQVKVGDNVKYDPKEFVRIKNAGGVKREEVNELPLEFIDDRMYMMLHERSLKFIYKRKQ